MKNTEKATLLQKLWFHISNFFFPLLPWDATSTHDLGLSAYLIYRGCSLKRVVVIGKRASFTIEGRGVVKHTNDYFQRKVITISPFVLFSLRDRLKEFIVATPFNDSTVFPKNV